MEISKLTELCEKKYPTYFYKDLISLYPYMIKCYGEEAIDNFLEEWTYKLVNRIGASGTTCRESKTIEVNEYNKFLWDYRIITATIHEVGHALGTLKIDTDDFLSDGDNLNDFFTKMDEAVVSDYQDDLLSGQLQYNYTDNYNFKCRGDVLHIEGYAVEKMYYNIFKIILGEQKNLITKMMYEKDLNKKKEIFDEIILIISEKISLRQLKCLIDSCAILIYNHGYHMSDANKKYEDRRKERRESLYKMNYDLVTSGEVSVEEFNEEFDSWFQSIYDDKYKRVREYVNKYNIEHVTITQQCDKLCEMTVDYLIDQLNKMNDFSFDLIKSACIYFSKIDNKTYRVKDKSKTLKKLLYQHLSKIDFNISQELQNEFSEEELTEIIIKLFSINEINLDTLSNFKLMKNNVDNPKFFYVSNGETFIKIGRYSNLQEDELQKHRHVNCDDIYVNTVIKKIELAYRNSIGDSNINKNLISTNKPLCEVVIKSKDLEKHL